MKYPKSRTTGKAGVLFVEQVVNAHGSVFRPVHQEDDLGIDGFIEIVENEIASGRLIGVQIKSGDSYLSTDGNFFEVAVDSKHLTYWLNYMLPVILVCHSPSKQVAAWVCIGDYVEHERYHGREISGKIKIPLYNLFDHVHFTRWIAGLAEVKAEERVLLKCVESCLDDDARVRRDAFSILTNHPSSRGLRITLFLARSFLSDTDTKVAKEALSLLGYGAGRRRWSWNPNNLEENALIAYASEICRDLSREEKLRAIELVDGEHFSGPQGLGERCFDVLACSEESFDILYAVATDHSLPMERRANALYMFFACDDDWLDDVRNSEPEVQDRAITDVLAWMYQDVGASIEEKA